MKQFAMILLITMLKICLLFAGQNLQELSDAKKIPYRVPKLNLAVDIDAVLDEDIWKQAEKLMLIFRFGPGRTFRLQ